MILDNDIILWEGKPTPTFKSTILSGGLFNIKFLDKMLILGIILLTFCYISYVEGNKMFFILFVTLQIINIFSPDFIKWIKKVRTCYLVNETEIVFYFGGFQEFFIKISYIEHVLIEEKDKGRMIVYFITRQPAVFKTYRFSDLQERLYPSFEYVQEGQSLIKILERKGIRCSSSEVAI